MFLLRERGGEWSGLPRGFLLFVGGLFLFLFFTLSKILLATKKICQSGARKLAKLESACLV